MSDSPDVREGDGVGVREEKRDGWRRNQIKKRMRNVRRSESEEDKGECVVSHTCRVRVVRPFDRGSRGL